ncbi:MAG: acyl-CoA thioesterase [Candidatus Dormibacteria bacterium]
MIDPFVRLREEREHYYDQEDLSPRPASMSRTEICMVMEIEHANNAGYVHGGTIMRLVDTAAGIAAGRHSRRRVVTAAMDDMTFMAPVYIGDMLRVRATVNDAHRTSMEVGVRVDVETLPTGESRQVSSAHLVFVALDQNGRPTPCAPVVAESENEKRRQAQARVRRDQRLLRKAALSEAAASRPGDAETG